MSQWYADNNRNEVTSYWEAFFVFAVFAFVLFMLYPKDLIKEQVLAEKSNYELTSIYLQNMLKIEPENVDLILAMAKVSAKRGNLDLSNELLNLLKSYTQKRIQSEVYDIKYNILLMKKYQEKREEVLEKIDANIKEILHKIIDEGLFKEEDTLKWYGISIQYNQKDIAMRFLKSIYSKKNDPVILEQCVYLAYELQKKEERIYCLEQLSESQNKDEAKKWLLALYQLHMGENNLKDALAVLKRLTKIDMKYQEELANLLASTRHYKESAQSYIKLYEMTSDKDKKIHYLFTALGVLQSNKLYTDAVNLVKSIEDDYLNDEKTVQKLMQFYLGINHVEDARLLSLKILEKMEK